LVRLVMVKSMYYVKGLLVNKSKKDTNPKAWFGSQKPSMNSTPTSALIEMGRVFEAGAKKYGLCNWRKDPVSASTYYNAIMRHLFSWQDGQDIDPDSVEGTKHLAAVMASCAILIDAWEMQVLIDDRPHFGNSPNVIERYTKDDTIKEE